MNNVSPALAAELSPSQRCVEFAGVAYPIARPASSVHFAGYAVASHKCKSPNKKRQQEGTQDMIALILMTLEHCLGPAYEDWREAFLRVDYPSLDQSFKALEKCFNQAVESSAGDTGRPPVSSGPSSGPPSPDGTTWSPGPQPLASSAPPAHPTPSAGYPSAPSSSSSSEPSANPVLQTTTAVTTSPTLWTPSGETE